MQRNQARKAPKSAGRQSAVSGRKAPKTRTARKDSRAGVVKTVVQPFQGMVMGSSLPSFNGKDTVRIAHREAVSSLRAVTLGDFAMMPQVGQSPGWDIAPGNPVLFPWLSNIALNYEQYHFHRLTFTLISAQGANQAGRVYMAVDYDWDDEVATTFADMMNNRTAVEGPVWSTLSLSCDPQAMHEDKYFKYTMNTVREAPEPRTTFCGFLMIATNVAINFTWDLIVEYDVEFRTPQGSGIRQYVSASSPMAPLITGTTTGGSLVVPMPLPTVQGLTRVAVPDSAEYEGVHLGGTQAIDASATPSAFIAAVSQVASASHSPQSIFSTCPTNPFKCLFFNHGWEYLGDSGQAGSTSTIAALNPQQVMTPGQPVVASTAVSLLAARAFNAAIRYLVPVLNVGPLASLVSPQGYTTLKTEL